MRLHNRLGNGETETDSHMFGVGLTRTLGSALERLTVIPLPIPRVVDTVADPGNREDQPRSPSRFARTARLTSWLGRRTLPIYVMHMPLLALADYLLRPMLNDTEWNGTALAAVEPLILTTLLVCVSLLLHRGLLALRLRWLFELPSRFTASVRRDRTTVS